MEDTPDMKVRMSADLRAKIMDAASRAGRSLNAEIRMRLEWSFEAEAEHAPERAADARSKLASLRLLSMNLKSNVDPVDQRLCALEEAVGAIKKKLGI